MMLDPITALGVAGNIVQFIDFGIKATSNAREIHRSIDGALRENTDIKIVTEDLVIVMKRLEALDCAVTGSDGLDDLCKRCRKAADELLSAMKGLKVDYQKSKMHSVRKVLKSIWGKRGVDEMKARLEGYRDELQFHVLVNMKSDMDVKSTKQSERFETLDAHAKAIFEAISEQQSIHDAIKTESVRSNERHIQMVATIVTKQEEGRLDITQTVTETADLVIEAVVANGESMQEIISSESLKSNDRYLQTTTAIVAKQEETHTEVIEILRTLDSTSRAEQEATRRELQQLKQAMAKIEQDMKKRDEELRGLLEAVSHTNNNQKRKQLQERSNAITVALYALATLYETLQKMISALQAHAKSMVTSANLKIWGPKTRCPLKTFPRRSMLDAVSNLPPDLLDLVKNPAEDDWNGGQYLMHIDPLLNNFSQVHRLWHVQFNGRETIDYKTIRHHEEWEYSTTRSLSLGDKDPNTGPSPSTRFSEHVCYLLRFLDLTSENPELRRTPNSRRDVESFKSVIILTSFLVACFGRSEAVTIIHSICPGLINLSPTSTSLYEDISVWSTMGQIAGFQTAAVKVLTDRHQKWGTTEPNVVEITRARKLLGWLFGQPEKSSFTFSVGGIDSTQTHVILAQVARAHAARVDTARAHAARDYALVEYLVEFGFPLHAPVIAIGAQSHVQAQVKRVI